MTYKRFSFALILTAGVSLFSAGCGKENGGNPPGQQPGAVQGIAFEPQMSVAEREAVSSSLEFISTHPIDGSQVKWFSEIFGASDSTALNLFIDDRLNYAISSVSNPDALLRVNGQKLPTGPPDGDDPRMAAANLSSPLWMLAKIFEPRKLQFQFGSDLLDIPSTRIGVIQIGPEFSNISYDEMFRAGVLIHEARHSDCTGGVHESELAQLARGEPTENSFCGHSHTLCPEGHELAGLAGCDGHSWGAYAVSAEYFAAVALACSTCTEAQRQVAIASANDNFGRILVDVEVMLAGELGKPDMSSSQAVIPG